MDESKDVSTVSGTPTRSNIDFASPYRLRSLSEELGIEAFGLSQMTLQPGQQSRIHRHQAQEEVYLVLNGTLTLVVERESHDVHSGELVRVPSSLRRQLQNRGDRPCVLLAIGAAGRHVGHDGEAFETWDSERGRSPDDVPFPENLPLSATPVSESTQKDL
jgi:uncharacterized cupin superfamily protein